MKGPKVLAGALVALYAAFVVWYGGRGLPMSQAESDALFAQIAARASKEPNPDGHLREHLETLAAQDDGNEFFMVNLIRFRKQAQYPPGQDYPGDARDADARYNAAIAPYLLKHGAVPILLGTPQGRFLDEPGDTTDWDRVAVVRYRSRRDLLRMVADLAGQDVAVHKWAAIEKTQVFPIQPIFSFAAVRGTVAAVLLLIGLVLHFALRRAAWYRGA